MGTKRRNKIATPPACSSGTDATSIHSASKSLLRGGTSPSSPPKDISIPIPPSLPPLFCLFPAISYTARMPSMGKPPLFPSSMHYPPPPAPCSPLSFLLCMAERCIPRECRQRGNSHWRHWSIFFEQSTQSNSTNKA